MTILTALLAVALFLAAFWLLRVVPVARAALAVAAQAMAAMRDPAVGDDVREATMRRASLALLGAFAQILIRSAAALALAALPICLADAVDIAPRREVFAFLARADVIVAITATTLVAWLAWSRSWRNR